MIAAPALAATLWLALPGAATPPDGDAVVAREAVPAAPSLMAPPAPRGVTRAQLTLRPFLGLVANSWGGIGEVRIEHPRKGCSRVRVHVSSRNR